VGQRRRRRQSQQQQQRRRAAGGSRRSAGSGGPPSSEECQGALRSRSRPAAAAVAGGRGDEGGEGGTHPFRQTSDHLLFVWLVDRNSGGVASWTLVGPFNSSGVQYAPMYQVDTGVGARLRPAGAVVPAGCSKVEDSIC